MHQEIEKQVIGCTAEFCAKHIENEHSVTARPEAEEIVLINAIMEEQNSLPYPKEAMKP